MERDCCAVAFEKTNINFNSHAHVERDNDDIVELEYEYNFNSHAHVERDESLNLLSDCVTISTHTLTWSVT